MVWHVDKYKITFQLVIRVQENLSRPGIIDARAWYRAVARRLRNTDLQYASDDGSTCTCNKTNIKQTKPYLLSLNTQAGILTLSVLGLKQNLASEATDTLFVGLSKSRNQGSVTFRGTEEKDGEERGSSVGPQHRSLGCKEGR